MPVDRMSWYMFKLLQNITGKDGANALAPRVVLNVFGVFAVDGTHLAKGAVLRQQRTSEEAGEYLEGAFGVRVGKRVVESGGVEAGVCVVAAVCSG